MLQPKAAQSEKDMDDPLLNLLKLGITNHATRCYIALDWHKQERILKIENGVEFWGELVEGRPLGAMANECELSENEALLGIQELESIGVVVVYWGEFPELGRYNIYEFARWQKRVPDAVEEEDRKKAREGLRAEGEDQERTRRLNYAQGLAKLKREVWCLSPGQAAVLLGIERSAVISAMDAGVLSFRRVEHPNGRSPIQLARRIRPIDLDAFRKQLEKRCALEPAQISGVAAAES
jgi:hypothetical protein